MAAEQPQRRRRKHGRHEDNIGFQIAPMIDVMFILILFFMCSAGAVQVERELGMKLPGTVQQGVKLKMPDEQIIEVGDDGTITLNGHQYTGTGEQALQEVLFTLTRFKQLADASKNPAMVTISTAANTRYQRIIDVMDMCAKANVSEVTFNAVEPGGFEMK